MTWSITVIAIPHGPREWQHVVDHKLHHTTKWTVFHMHSHKTMQLFHFWMILQISSYSNLQFYFINVLLPSTNWSTNYCFSLTNAWLYFLSVLDDVLQIMYNKRFFFFLCPSTKWPSLKNRSTLNQRLAQLHPCNRTGLNKTIHPLSCQE